MLIIVESASIYTSVHSFTLLATYHSPHPRSILTVILLVLFQTRSDGVAVALPFVNPLIVRNLSHPLSPNSDASEGRQGIVYSLITIQIALGLNAFGRGSDMSAPTLQRASGIRVRTSVAAPLVTVPFDTLKYAPSNASRSELALAAKSMQGEAGLEG